jgi:hypothetical protein
LFANAAARAQAENLSLRLDAGTEMSGPPAVIKALRKLIGDAVRGGAGGTTCLSRTDGSDVGVTVAPVRGRALDHPSHHPAGRPAAMALLVDVSRSHEAAAAATLGISPNTLKSHTKRIYAKIGIRGHAELVQSIAQISRSLGPSM